MKNNIHIGIIIMLGSSLFTCTGQLFWKLAALHSSLIYILCGFALYGCGALLMILALKFGDLSVLHPMLGVGYIFSIILSSVALHEQFQIRKLFGIMVIFFGLVCLSRSSGEKKK